MIELPRRRFLTGLASLIAAPAIVRVASIMPVKAVPSGITIEDWRQLVRLVEIEIADQFAQDFSNLAIYGTTHPTADALKLGVLCPPQRSWFSLRGLSHAA
jgi:hypothetical protein